MKNEEKEEKKRKEEQSNPKVVSLSFIFISLQFHTNTQVNTDKDLHSIFINLFIMKFESWKKVFRKCQWNVRQTSLCNCCLNYWSHHDLDDIIFSF